MTANNVSCGEGTFFSVIDFTIILLLWSFKYRRYDIMVNKIQKKNNMLVIQIKGCFITPPKHPHNQKLEHQSLQTLEPQLANRQIYLFVFGSILFSGLQQPHPYFPKQ